MVYKNNIPQGSDRPSLSRAEILENFSQLDSQYGSSGDHVEFTASSNNGKHKKSTYIATSDPTTGAAEIALYAKTVSAATELYLRQVSAGSIIQMSRGAPVAAQPGRSFLPGGILIQWGAVSAGPGGAAVAFSQNFTSSVFTVVATSLNTSSSANATVSNIGLSGCIIHSSSTNTVYYIAIGV